MLLQKNIITASASGATEIIAGIANQRIYVRRLLLQAASEVTVKFREASTDLSAPYVIGAKGSWCLDDSGIPWYVTSPGEGLDLNLSSAVQMAGEIWYEQR
jgi:hypothetical protein